MPNMGAYYSDIAQNFIDGKIYIARKRFEALSQKQRKAYFPYLIDEWQLTSADPVYSYFFELL